MPLKINNKILKLARYNWAATLWIAVLGLTVSGCISSTEPVLTGANAILGDRGRMEVFSAPTKGSRDILRLDFEWRRDRYVTGAGRPGAIEFTAHPFEGRDIIVQWKNAAVWSPKTKSALRPVTYHLLRKVADGAYLLFPLTEDDVDETTRARFCVKSPETACRISTPEQLFVFAKAAAEKDESNPGIVVISPATAKRTK
jgi:hypothetical protein